MMVLVTYDVQTINAAGRKRLQRVARECVNFGQRVQNSVFECIVDPAQFADLKHRLASIIDKEKDSLRYYILGTNWKKRVEHIGAKESYNPEEDALII